MSRYVWQVAAWRDIDSSRRSLGVKVWLFGAQVNLGRRLYRATVAVPR